MHLDSKSSDRKGKETQLEALFESCYDRIARYALVRLGNQSDAEDLAGEVFLKALESLDSYKERGVPMQAWLFKIAHNLIVDYFRKSAKRKTVSIDTVSIKMDSDLEEKALAELEVAQVVKALGGLTEFQRRVIELRFFGELTSEEAGRVLNKRAGAVRQLQSAAIKTLRNLLDEEPPLKEDAI
jgi:RNA polymerase sigma-70 factor (ECF subfamily)